MGCSQGILYGGKGSMLSQQLVGICVTAAWSGSFTFVILKLIDATVGLKLSPKELQQFEESEEIGSLDSSAGILAAKSVGVVSLELPEIVSASYNTESYRTATPADMKAPFVSRQ